MTRYDNKVGRLKWPGMIKKTMEISNFPIFWLIVPDEGYSNLLTMIVPDEGYSNLLTMIVPDEGYSRNVPCTLN
jgi:hypothetical protein